jgi:hypothetical protein
MEGRGWVGRMGASDPSEARGIAVGFVAAKVKEKLVWVGAEPETTAEPDGAELPLAPCTLDCASIPTTATAAAKKIVNFMARSKKDT